MTQPLVIFNHIPKSAGMSILELLRRNYPDGELLELYSERGSAPPPSRPHEFKAFFDSMPTEQWEKLRCMSGHAVHHAIPLLDRPFRAFSLVRDPVDRVVSLYHFCRDNRELSGYGAQVGEMIRKRGWSLRDLLRYFTGTRPHDGEEERLAANFFNGQTRALLANDYPVVAIPMVGRPANSEELLALLDRVLREHYVIGCTELYEASVKRFAGEFGWQDETIVHVNANPHRPARRELPDDLVQAIRNSNLLDIELHRRALAELGASEAAVAPSRPSGPRKLPYLRPAELLHELVEDSLPIETEVVERSVVRDLERTELRLLSEIAAGEKLFMHGWLCRPLAERGLLGPTMVIPGGRGAIQDRERASWMAHTAHTLVLAIDHIGAGRSTRLPKELAWRKPGADYRDSFEYHNLRGLLRALEVLVSQPDADKQRLGVIGTGSGGFYAWLLAGLDPRIRHIVASFGCGFARERDRAESWLSALDPGRRAHLIKAKIFYQAATNDPEFPLPAAIDTYSRARAPKRLLLIANQARSTHPYDGQDAAMLAAMLHGTHAQAMPEIHSVRWVPGTNLVKVDAARPEASALSVFYSGGGSRAPAARFWREAQAKLSGGRYVAEIPVVDPGREISFYGHAVIPAPHSAPTPAARMAQPDRLLRGASTPVQTLVPLDAGLDHRTAEFDPTFELGSRELFELPITVGRAPAMRIVHDGDITALAMRFGPSSGSRGTITCLEGDLIKAAGHNAIELRLRLPNPADAQALDVCLVSDLATVEEQEHRIALDAVESPLGTWQTVTIPFGRFGRLDPERLSAVGFGTAQRGSRGEVWLAAISTAHVPEVTSTGVASRRRSRIRRPQGVGPYDVFIETALPADELRAQLRQWQPFRHEVIFSNGVRTSELSTAQPFSAHPASPWKLFDPHVHEQALRGRRVLDVGAEIGARSLYLRGRYDAEVVGLEQDERDLAIARFLLGASETDGVQFVGADASSYRSDRRFALIVHFGMLHRLKHPSLALENAHAMLEPGGLLALSTRAYEDPSGNDELCLFVPAPNGARWLLGQGALLGMLRQDGFTKLRVLGGHDAQARRGRLNVLAQTAGGRDA